MRSAIRLLEVFGCDGEMRLHLPSPKFTNTLFGWLTDANCLSKMSNVISTRNQTTWANTDARASHRAFYEPTHNRKIAIRELGGLGRLMISRGA